jgi:hypothetical protein
LTEDHRKSTPVASSTYFGNLQYLVFNSQINKQQNEWKNGTSSANFFISRLQLQHHCCILNTPAVESAAMPASSTSYQQLCQQAALHTSSSSLDAVKSVYCQNFGSTLDCCCHMSSISSSKYSMARAAVAAMAATNSSISMATSVLTLCDFLR